MVTDLRRLCGDATSLGERRRRAVALAAAASAAGVDLIQVRERDLDAQALTLLVQDIVDACRDTATRVVVNERVDVAIAAGAHGVHLRGDSLTARDVRRLVPPAFLVGRSVHRLSECRDAGPVDYLIAGAVFPTSSKPDGHPLLSLSDLGAMATAAEVPVLAIGGVTPARLGLLAATGVSGVAGIGLFSGPVALDQVSAAIRAAFDTPQPAP